MAFFVPNLGNRTHILPSRIRYNGIPVTTPLKYCLHLYKAYVVSNHRYHNRQHYYHYHNQKLFHCHCHIYSRIVIILLMLSDSYRLPIQLFQWKLIALPFFFCIIMLSPFHMDTSQNTILILRKINWGFIDRKRHHTVYQNFEYDETILLPWDALVGN